MSNARRVHFSRRRPSGPLRSRRRMQPRHLARRARLRLRHARREVLAVLAVAVALLVVATGVTVAFFTSSGSSTASATAGTLNPPTNVTATQVASSSNVTVSWTAPTGTTAPTGYYVTRTPSGGSAAAACATSATTTITALTCTDSSVPAGTYTYRVVAVFRSWTATSSPASITVTAVVAPVISITHPGAANGSGYYTSWNIGCNGSADRVCADVTSGAGNLTVQANSVKLVIRRAADDQCYDGAGTNPVTDWSLAACDTPLPMTLNTAPQYRSNNLFASGALIDGTLTFTVSATNSAGVSASASVTRVFDSAVPTATMTPASPGYTSTGLVTISGSDANGIASISYRINANSGAFTTVNGAGPVTFTRPVGSHTIDYYVTDTLGRSSTQVDNRPVVVDNTAPSVGTLVPTSLSGGTSFGAVACTTPANSLCATVSDSGNTGLSVGYELRRAADGFCYDGAGTAAGDWTSAACSSDISMSVQTGSVYTSGSVLSSGYSTQGKYTLSVTGTDGAGNSTTATSTFYIDTANPSQATGLPAAGTKYDVDPVADPDSGVTDWSTVCSTGRFCVGATDNLDVKSVTYSLKYNPTGNGQDRCYTYNGTTSGLTAAGNCTAAAIAMTYDSASQQWQGNAIPSTLLAQSKGAVWDVTIVVTDYAGNTSTITRTIDFT